MSCKKCGCCCEAIYIAEDLEHLKNSAKKYPGKDAEFILNYWEPISEEEAIKINPHLKNLSKQYNFYKCNAFDKQTRLCTIQETKGRVCKDFPFYTNKFLHKNFFFYSPTCGYNVPESFEEIGIIKKD